ncbi:MAG: ChbG/HpnK family deacetylase [Christensenellaceae bacterium]|jgi:predicted glycoside hydrolase/deacetylase ChbG (UPF0249 family)|nr:ChbG/HpnK family deacetylase [Christensenellaceae bacterium]
MDNNKYLIINADDFGVCPETNKAISELYQSKHITSVSIMPVATHIDEAIDIAKKINMPVGIHWAFNSDYPDNPWKPIDTEAKSLVDESGHLSSTSYFAKHAKSKDVTRELIAQYLFLIDRGLNVEHADSHCGTVYGINGRGFFKNAFEVCQKYGLPFRFPNTFNFIGDYVSNMFLLKLVKVAYSFILKSAKRHKVKLINHMIANHRDIKDISSYKDFENSYINDLRLVKPGITEFFTHPSYFSPAMAKYNGWNEIRGFDLEFLNSDKFANTLKDEGIIPCSYGIFNEQPN